MSVPTFEPREGGVKIVFDVLEGEIETVSRSVTAAGFDVRRYYDPEFEHARGGSARGWIRLGAHRRMRTFSGAEEQRIVAAFDAAQHDAGFSCLRHGTDSWTAGDSDNDDVAGVREPRRPMPRAGAGSAAAPIA